MSKDYITECASAAKANIELFKEAGFKDSLDNIDYEKHGKLTTAMWKSPGNQFLFGNKDVVCYAGDKCQSELDSSSDGGPVRTDAEKILLMSLKLDSEYIRKNAVTQETDTDGEVEELMDDESKDDESKDDESKDDES